MKYLIITILIVALTGCSATDVLPVDKVVANPEEYSGTLQVSGKVLELTNDSFTLGCDDACVMMPVKYDGELPSKDSHLIVVGEIRKNEEGYFFLARHLR